ncbi:MAG: MFS transporter [Betaproteobacteria bacterium]|nr:MFS transporter [Betaproteobacteria bacterium]
MNEPARPASTDSPAAQAAPLPPVWRQREYLLLWSGQVIATVGANASGIIYPLLILALTRSPALASWAAALRILPFLLLCLPVGALVDRWDRRRVMMVCHAGRGLAVAVLPVAMWADVLTVGLIYAVAVVEGALHVFFNIAETSALPRVVAATQLPAATAQNQAGFAAAVVVGPPVGTWLYQTAGRAWPFVLDVFCHFAAALALARMKTSFAPAPVPAGARRSLAADVAEGLRWLWHERLVRDMALITSVLNFVGAATPLALIVLAKRLGASDAEIGLVFSLGGLGAIVGAAVGGAIARRFSFGQVIIGVIAVQALLFPLFALCPSAFWLGVVYGLLMLAGPVYNVVQLAYRIALIPDGLQGRVHSSFRLIAHALNPVGALACGWALEHFGGGWTVALFAAVYFALLIATAADPVVRRAPRQQPAAHETA